MGPLNKATRAARRPGLAMLILVCTFTLAAGLGFSANSNAETIQATYAQASNTVNVTLVVYNYSTPADLQMLSQAFQEGKDRGLADALSKTKAVGQCSIAGAISYDVAFIQMVPTRTGRRIIFITNRPHRLDDADPPASAKVFDLAVGQFDLNDADPSKSTGFLFPASKLVIDQQGEFHYDLAGSPWALENVLDSQGTPA
jgi:hypothetical protein